MRPPLAPDLPSHPTPGSPVRRGTRLALALLLAAPLVACAGVRTGGNPDFSLDFAATYAWSPASESEGRTDPEIPWEAFTEAVERELRERGLEPAPFAEADLHVLLDLDIVERTQQNDPYFDLVVAERFEESVMTLELVERGNPANTWTAERRHRLRYTAETMGGIAGSRWTELDQEREWRVEDNVERTLAQLR